MGKHDKGYYPEIVSNTFVDIAEQEGNSISPIKMQKLIFFAHGFMLGVFERPLVTDDFYAWSNGPVIPELYRKIKEQYSPEVLNFENYSTLPKKSQEYDIVSVVWKTFGSKSTSKLIDYTHRKDMPWYFVWQEGGYLSKIPNKIIEKCFKKLNSL